jgi:hypothetical protein
MLQTGPSVNGTVTGGSFTFPSVCEYYLGSGVGFLAGYCVCEQPVMRSLYSLL